MSEPHTLGADLEPDISNIVTEDDTVDNFAFKKLQRLLVESLYNSCTPSDCQTFLAAANVALNSMP